jgi:hypothetical protein
MLLRAYRHLKPKDDDTFSIFGSDTLSNAWQNLTGAITGMAFAVVSVFLVVGGIVIMNIMLAVVTERTREIGIRKSLGARRPGHLESIPGRIGGAVYDGRLNRRGSRVSGHRCGAQRHTASHGNAAGLYCARRGIYRRE